ncbi:MAG TPA: hypothetical protein VNP92_04250 [Actinophytocola sp.]|nr:hypothetical protein [Actinophytocola sp.]
MTVTPTTLTRAAGVAAVLSGLLFIGVQINHPAMDVASVTTNEWAVRNSLKVVMAALALAGIAGMYLSQVRKTGLLGLLGYLVLSTGYLIMLSVAFVSAYVLPSLADAAPTYVSDVLAAASASGDVTGDIGLMATALLLSGITYVAGGLIFGIALFRAGVLARWAAALLAVATVASLAIPLVPQFERLFAIPTGIALAGLGYSLWRAHRTPAARTVPSPLGERLDPADAR